MSVSHRPDGERCFLAWLLKSLRRACPSIFQRGRSFSVCRRSRYTTTIKVSSATRALSSQSREPGTPKVHERVGRCSRDYSCRKIQEHQQEQYNLKIARHPPPETRCKLRHDEPADVIVDTPREHIIWAAVLNANPTCAGRRHRDNDLLRLRPISPSALRDLGHYPVAFRAR